MRSNKHYLLIALTSVLAACSTVPVENPQPQPQPKTETVSETPTPIDTGAKPATTTPASTTVVMPAKPVVQLNKNLQTKFDEGVKALNAKEYERALSLFAAIQIAQADYPPAYLNAALAERGRGKLDAARAQLDGALVAGIKDARVAALMGLIERERGQFAAAKSAYQEAIALDATYAPAYRNLAVLADLYLHDAVLAFQNMEKYVQLMPDDKQASGWLAEIKRRAGVKTEAAQ